jgi:8-oxo-dGTP pyrophosphatase MutT (NUDIX family)
VPHRSVPDRDPAPADPPVPPAEPLAPPADALAPPADALAPPADAEPQRRRAARILVVDAAGRILLFRGWDPARPSHWYWFTPGGGLDPGESPAEGAARELAEETGLRVRPEELGPPVWEDVTTFPFDGEWYRQDQKFFLLRVPAWEVNTAGFDRIERRSIDKHRWWSIDELASTDDRVYPAELADLLRRVLTAREGLRC